MEIGKELPAEVSPFNGLPVDATINLIIWTNTFINLLIINT